MTEIDPAIIRNRLSLQRGMQAHFGYAWRAAIGGMTITDHDAGMMGFIKTHFKAAYENDDVPEGRCPIPPRDTSTAIPMSGNLYSPDRIGKVVAPEPTPSITDVDLRDAIHDQRGASLYRSTPQWPRPLGPLVATVAIKRDGRSCRSGDGCDKEAMRGRFGPRFCDEHADRLEAISLVLGLDAERDHKRGSGRQHDVAA